MKSKLIMDQHFRKREELFSAAGFDALCALCDVIGGENQPMPQDVLRAHIEDMTFLVAAKPALDRDDLERAGNLKAVIEVSGTFQEGLDYQACFDRGIEVLSCAPGFKYAVAEMAVGMMIAGARGLVQEHEAFRTGAEDWLQDKPATDFTLYGQEIGFVGYGGIARECHRLLKPFSPTVRAFDPWLGPHDVAADGIQLCDLEELVSKSRCLVVAASPTDENWQLIGKREIAQMQTGTLVVVISRSHLVDFDALVRAASDGRIRVAIDVFPSEPVAPDDPVRAAPNVILSPHRAAAVDGGRHPIGDMIVDDIGNILVGRKGRSLQAANPDSIQRILRAPRVRAQHSA